MTPEQHARIWKAVAAGSQRQMRFMRAGSPEWRAVREKYKIALIAGSVYEAAAKEERKKKK